MKNEVSERREGRVLYEPPEPLFPDLPPRRSKILVRAAACVILACVVLGIWMLAVSADEKNEDTGRTQTEEKTEQPQEESEKPALDTESEEETESSHQTERQTESNEETASLETESDTQETEAPTTNAIESDLSLAERGDAYIVNYTDNAVEIAELLDRGFVDSEKKNSPAPVVMVLHTHTSEGYFGGNNVYLDGVISVGDILSRRLNELGLTTLHCTVIHDQGENNAYTGARETIETMLKIYPSIKYVIDLHRMELESNGAPIKTVSKEGTAQIRLTVSADCRGWQENLSLALSLRKKLNENGARVCMPPTLSPSRYNSDLPRYYMMVDVGATGNTVREAEAAADKLAEALADTILKK